MTNPEKKPEITVGRRPVRLIVHTDLPTGRTWVTRADEEPVTDIDGGDGLKIIKERGIKDEGDK